LFKLNPQQTRNIQLFLRMFYSEWSDINCFITTNFQLCFCCVLIM